MSDNYLKLVPRDPSFVPDPDARKDAAAFLRVVAPLADDIALTLSDEVQFVDCGGNWEGVRCPHCKADLEEWWSDALDEAAASGFTDMTFELPCCSRSCSLAELEFPWPVAFARFVLEVRNANIGGELGGDQLAELERILGTPLRLIRAHY